ncbi:hypothetical protein I3F58_15375 [Streptomyces sp. MUM 203J]|uniref:trypsin-like serine peptidase n=1 Tax=Streptomyces sp. MUM 203J TaxID=2791990 RepID=UPI001F04F104|nr:hypothetical protein [Streptomyces sp. MUM 203J]MCH0540925.1 hypothetical protein [Streptomyces sp. MUM 203J]
MRRIRPLFATAVVAALALTATGCGPSEDEAGGAPTASASTAVTPDAKLPVQVPENLEELKERLKEHGLDLDKWRDGEWKNWDRDKWLREAQDFVNPVIEDLWDPDRIREADEPNEPVEDEDISGGGDDAVTDPAPERKTARPVKTPYHQSAPEAGKLLFDGPKGSMVCSATVVKDPRNPGRSNLVWTAGHCVHAGKDGGWFRNIAFVPSYNDSGLTSAQLEKTTREQVAPYGLWWADWAQTSEQWIGQGTGSGGQGAPYDFAVIHVKPEKGGNGKSLEETVGSALAVDFEAPAAQRIASVEAIGYPASAPYDGAKLFGCADKPGRLSVQAAQPTMYRIGCSMTGGSSGGGWVHTGEDGERALVSNTSIGALTAGWLAGPRLGDEAEGVYTAVSDKFAGR